jgi:nitrogen regulatory protein PII
MMQPDGIHQPSPKLIVAIIDYDDTPKLEDVLREKRVHLYSMFSAMGTGRTEVLKSLGLSGTQKTVCLCLSPRAKALPLMHSIADRLSLSHIGQGLAFVMPVSATSASVSNLLCQESSLMKERPANQMNAEKEIKEEALYSLVVAVVNQGFSEQVMDAAHAVGVLGGTIIHARQPKLEDVVKFFGVALQDERELVTILVAREQKKELMQAIAKSCGMNTQAHGIVFSLPVEHCAGIEGCDCEECTY